MYVLAFDFSLLNNLLRHNCTTFVLPTYSLFLTKLKIHIIETYFALNVIITHFSLLTNFLIHNSTAKPPLTSNQITQSHLYYKLTL